MLHANDRFGQIHRNYTDYSCRLSLRMCITFHCSQAQAFATTAPRNTPYLLLFRLILKAGDSIVREGYFTTCAEDRPLIAQLGASNEDDFIGAAKLLQVGDLFVSLHTRDSATDIPPS